MTKKRMGAICLAFLMTVQLAVPVYADTAKQQEWKQIQTEINAKNEKLDAPNAALNQYKYQYTAGKSKVTEKDIKQIKEYKESKVKKTITSAAAQKEVAWMFRLLRGQYGLYTYFGGDAKFEKAQAKILKKLKTYQKPIPVKTYEKILYNQLKFINDNHFCVGETYGYGAKVSLFGNETAEFTKKDGQFYLNSYPNWPVTTVDQKSPESVIKRAIGMKGDLTWLPYLMAATAKEYQLSVQFADGTKQTIVLSAISFQQKEKIIQEDYQNIFALSEKNGIPEIEMGLMVFQDGGFMEKIRNQFLDSIPTIQKAKNAVIDVRNNPGGDGQLVEDWFQAYTKEKLQPNYSTLRIRPTGAWAKNAVDVKEYDKVMTQMGLTIQGNYYVGAPSKQFLTNNATSLFVRTSRMTASSAEGFTDAVKNMNDVVVVGTNTGGVLTNGANYSFALPYSNLFFQFGECLFYWDQAYFKESYGMEPDIWLTGDREEERFDQFLQDYAQ